MRAIAVREARARSIWLEVFQSWSRILNFETLKDARRGGGFDVELFGNLFDLELTRREDQLVRALTGPIVRQDLDNFTTGLGPLTIDTLARNQIGRLVVELSRGQKRALREQLVLLFAEGPTDEILMGISSATGLTARQARSVQNLRRRLIRDGVPSGSAVRRAQEHARRLLRRRARLIARTESVRFTALLVDERGAQVAGMVKQWVSARDGNVDDICISLDSGQRVPSPRGRFSGISGQISRPPAHPGCLPGDAVITASPPIAAQTERWYDGDLVVVSTTGDQELTCTPNHPILTDRGWIPASLLHVGAHVLGHLLRERMTLSAEMDNQHVPTRIEEIANTLGIAGSMTSMPVPVAAPDFHGDGMDGQVAIIRTDRALWDTYDPDVTEHGLEENLVGRATGSISFAAQGHADPLGHRVRAAGGRFVGGSDLSLSLCGIHSRPFQPLGFRLTSWADSMIQEEAPQSSTTDLFLLCESLLRHAGQIVVHDVTGVRRVPFAGHVYNLQTEGGWYAVSGIITHNCRCVIELSKTKPGPGRKTPKRRPPRIRPPPITEPPPPRPPPPPTGEARTAAQVGEQLEQANKKTAALKARLEERALQLKDRLRPVDTRMGTIVSRKRQIRRDNDVGAFAPPPERLLVLPEWDALSIEQLQLEKQTLSIRQRIARNLERLDAVTIRREASFRQTIARPKAFQNKVRAPIGTRQRTRLRERRRGVESFRELVSDRWLPATETPVRIVSTRGGRSFVLIGQSDAIHVGPWAGPQAVVHEFGHILEHRHIQIRDASLRFLDRRTAGEAAQWLGPGFARSEIARRDAFIDAYVGKDYRRRATEVLSKGLEYMHRDALAFWNGDPDHFAYIWDIMRGIIPQ